MNSVQALVLGTIVVLVVLIVAAYVWFYYTGWSPFSFKGTVPYLPGSSCATNTCPTGQKCVNKQCITPCDPSTPCPQGQTCVSGMCVAGTTPSWTAEGSADVSSLRFNNCTFTVVDPQGQSHSADVTAALNGMAVGYRNSKTEPPRTLRLDRPLNAFSFVIPGVNDSNTVTSAAQANQWMSCASFLTGQWRTI